LSGKLEEPHITLELGKEHTVIRLRLDLRVLKLAREIVHNWLEFVKLYIEVEEDG